MNWLHSHNIVHGNLTLNNIFIDDFMNITLSDYGPSYYNVDSKYAATEKNFTFYSDLWQLGIVYY